MGSSVYCRGYERVVCLLEIIEKAAVKYKYFTAALLFYHSLNLSDVSAK